MILHDFHGFFMIFLVCDGADPKKLSHSIACRSWRLFSSTVEEAQHRPEGRRAGGGYYLV